MPDAGPAVQIGLSTILVAGGGFVISLLVSLVGTFVGKAWSKADQADHEHSKDIEFLKSEIGHVREHGAVLLERIRALERDVFKTTRTGSYPVSEVRKRVAEAEGEE